jgi:hypothetical protein
MIDLPLCKFRLTRVGFFAFLLLQQKNEAGAAFVTKTVRPFGCLQAPDRRSGRIPVLPYPPLEQMTDFPFPFPLGSRGRETGNGSLSW